MIAKIVAPFNISFCQEVKTGAGKSRFESEYRAENRIERFILNHCLSANFAYDEVVGRQTTR
jgi:hypothetical protein